mmetsp:Transcript_97303/g.208787  ORF Transcript_97303/g.208787 Transcript_97303/m.208787 type:complete len:268 (+) Transcript_97303:92-895(+)
MLCVQLLDKLLPALGRLPLRRGTAKSGVDCLVAERCSIPDPELADGVRQVDQLSSALIGDLVLCLERFRCREDVRIIELSDHADLQHSPELRLASGVEQHGLPSLKLHASVRLESFKRELCKCPLLRRLGKGILHTLGRREILVGDLAGAHDQRGCGGSILDHGDELLDLPSASCCQNCEHLAAIAALWKGRSENLPPLLVQGAVRAIGHGLIVAVLEGQGLHSLPGAFVVHVRAGLAPQAADAAILPRDAADARLPAQPPAPRCAR